RVFPLLRREQSLLEQLRQLRSAERAAIAERRGIDARPQAPSVGNDEEEPAIRREHAPELTEQRARLLRPFEHMHEQDAVGALVVERKLGLLDERAHRLPLFR